MTRKTDKKYVDDDLKIKDIFNLKNKINIIYIFLLLLPIIDLLTALQTRFTGSNFTIGLLSKGIMMLFVVYYLLFKCKTNGKKYIYVYFALLIVYSIFYFITKTDIASTKNLILEVTNLFKFSFYPILLLGLINLDKEKIIVISYLRY